PMLTQIFEHGADIAVHSATKYMGGHGTTIAGVVVDSGKFDWVANAERFPGLTKPDPSYHGVVWSDALGPAAYIGRVRTVMLRNTGAALSPFNAFLILQGLETLALRMERHSENALAVAKHLKNHAGVTWVNYSGLEDDKYHETAKRILNKGVGFGGIVTFGIDGGREAGKTFIEGLDLFTHLANIGDARSLAIHNASTTHSQLNDEELEAAGVGQDTVRLSVGIENIGDILADIDQALAKATA
ncbi:MAG: O-acetylhomoserine aminocarboxypropyltransferase/cysteine synthase, partial [Thermoleophilia bacterium]|nr:O-acetylhomoserine aminocarboxypropyltransferase/cysteine synthase [Thermoleophilia bacterium]